MLSQPRPYIQESRKNVCPFSHSQSMNLHKRNLFMKLTECILKCLVWGLKGENSPTYMRKNCKYLMILPLKVFLRSNESSSDSPQCSERFLEDSTNLNSRLTCRKAGHWHNIRIMSQNVVVPRTALSQL